MSKKLGLGLPFREHATFHCSVFKCRHVLLGPETQCALEVDRSEFKFYLTILFVKSVSYLTPMNFCFSIC